MGVNTKGYFDPNYKTADIVKVLQDKFGVQTTVSNTYTDNYKIISFMYKDEKRNLSVFENYADRTHTGKSLVTLVELNLWGSSVELIKGIVEQFGGYMMENDYTWKEVAKVGDTPAPAKYLNYEHVIDQLESIKSNDLGVTADADAMDAVNELISKLETLQGGKWEV